MNTLEKYRWTSIYEFQFANKDLHDILLKHLADFPITCIESKFFSENDNTTVYLSLKYKNFGVSNHNRKKSIIENIYELANIIIELHKELHPEK